MFVNTVAHLQSTFATRGTLQITLPEGIEVEHATGHTVQQAKLGSSLTSQMMALGIGLQQDPTTIQLGNIQYGQSRDIFLRYTNPDAADIIASLDLEAGLQAKLQYSLMMVPEYIVQTTHNLNLY